MNEILPVKIGLPILGIICLGVFSIVLILRNRLFFIKTRINKIKVFFEKYFEKNPPLIKRVFKDSLINFFILISPIVLYLAINFAVISSQFIDKSLGWIQVVEILRNFSITIGALIAFFTFLQNFEYRFFEGRKQRYEKLRELLNKKVLDQASLDEAIAIIRALAEVNQSLSLLLFGRLVRVEKKTTQEFIRNKLINSPLIYFTGCDSHKLLDPSIDIKNDRLIGEKLRASKISIDESEVRLFSHFKNILENHSSSDDSDLEPTVVRRISTSFWAFRSGLNLEHIFVILGFVYDVPPENLDYRMRYQNSNKLKTIRDHYPRLSACLFYLWEIHDKGRTFKFMINLDLSHKVKEEIY